MYYRVLESSTLVVRTRRPNAAGVSPAVGLICQPFCHRGRMVINRNLFIGFDLRFMPSILHLASASQDLAKCPGGAPLAPQSDMISRAVYEEGKTGRPVHQFRPAPCRRRSGRVG